MTVAMGSRAVLQHSLKVSRTKTDDSGNTRLTKSRNNTARDDVTAASDPGRRAALAPPGPGEPPQIRGGGLAQVVPLFQQADLLFQRCVGLPYLFRTRNLFPKVL